MPLASRALEARVVFPSYLRAPAHPRYNCHGLTFASRRTAIHEDDDIHSILYEDGYKEVDITEVSPGDVAIYYTNEGTIDHSALVVSKPLPPLNMPVVCSKWGVIGPEVVHMLTNCPDYAVSNIHYFRIKP